MLLAGRCFSLVSSGRFLGPVFWVSAAFCPRSGWPFLGPSAVSGVFAAFCPRWGGRFLGPGVPAPFSLRALWVWGPALALPWWRSARIPSWDSSVRPAPAPGGSSSPSGVGSPGCPQGPRCGVTLGPRTRRPCVFTPVMLWPPAGAAHPPFRLKRGPGFLISQGAPQVRCDVGSSDSAPVRLNAGDALAARWSRTPPI